MLMFEHIRASEFHEIFLHFLAFSGLNRKYVSTSLDCSDSGGVKSPLSLQFTGSTRYLRLLGIVALIVGCGTIVLLITIAILILAMVD
jgi:hypothetical protein